MRHGPSTRRLRTLSRSNPACVSSRRPVAFDHGMQAMARETTGREAFLRDTGDPARLGRAGYPGARVDLWAKPTWLGQCAMTEWAALWRDL